MTVPASYRPASGSVPDAPGVYRFRDKHGRVLYVGKAKSLRSRLNSYFADISRLAARTARMVTSASSVDWVVVGTESEAMHLEYNWIKEHEPLFNVVFKDDKSYPYLAVTLNEEYPRAMVTRAAKRKGVKYFGPYARVWAISETLDSLLRLFPVRTCSMGVFKRARAIGRPCLLGDIGKCSAPCVGRVTAEEHREIVDGLCGALAGKTDVLVRDLEKGMRAASEEQEYERAARLRDDLTALRKAIEKQAVVLGDGSDADVVAFADDELSVAVQVFHVRTGRVRGERGWIIEKGPDTTPADLVEQFCLQVYGEPDADVPREVLAPALPDDVTALEELLSERRGSKVRLRVPQRGEKRALAETVQRNAVEALVQNKLRRASDLTSRSAALNELAAAIGMTSGPLRIECYDISHVQGTDVVASMVVFEDGLPRKSEYRRFRVRGEANNDVASMAEVLRRRFARSAALDSSSRFLRKRGLTTVDDTGFLQNGAETEGLDAASSSSRKSVYPPGLVIVDGGQPQVNAVAKVFAELGVDRGEDPVALIGLAKRLEEVWLPNQAFPVVLPRTSEALYLLQRLRDEAHRFANTFHRERRAKRMTTSALDSIPGLGPVRRKALLKHFGSVKRLREAIAEDVAKVPGIGPALADIVVTALRSDGPSSASPERRDT